MAEKKPMVSHLTFAYFTEAPELGSEFKSWPQHLPLSAIVEVTAQRRIGTSVLNNVANTTYAFDVEIGEAGELPSGEPAWLLEEKKRSKHKAMELHKRIFRGLRDQKARGVNLKALEQIDKDYLPYIIQRPEPHPQLYPGYWLSIDHLALVQRTKIEPNTQTIIEIVNLKQ